MNPRLDARWLAGVVVLAASASPAWGQGKKIDLLHIGSSGTLAGAKSKEQSALTSLQSFIKDETGFTNDIVRQNGWQELAQKMAKGELHVGVFQGFEFAWASEKFPQLKPLALAVNVYRYPTAYVIAKRDASIKDFAGLQGKIVTVPATGAGYLRFYLEREAEASGKPPAQFFAQIKESDTAEDALDDVVDGQAQATVVDRATADGYKRRKPARWNQLAPVKQSPPFPPTVIAVFDNVLDQATQDKFRKGLLNAATKERGKTTISMFHLSGFESVAGDFDKVLKETRKNFPPKTGTGG